MAHPPSDAWADGKYHYPCIICEKDAIALDECPNEDPDEDDFAVICAECASKLPRNGGA